MAERNRKFYERVTDALSLFVRQHAWLNAPVERAKHDKSDKPRQSRLEKARAQRKNPDYAPDMPPVDVPYLLEVFFEIGPTMAAGMGAGPITHEEIRAWQANTGVELQPWQIRALRRMSFDYLGEAHEAEKADRRAPWEPVEVDYSAVANNMMNAIRRMAGS